MKILSPFFNWVKLLFIKRKAIGRCYECGEYLVAKDDYVVDEELARSKKDRAYFIVFSKSRVKFTFCKACHNILHNQW